MRRTQVLFLFDFELVGLVHGICLVIIIMISKRDLNLFDTLNIIIEGVWLLEESFVKQSLGLVYLSRSHL